MATKKTSQPVESNGLNTRMNAGEIETLLDTAYSRINYDAVLTSAALCDRMKVFTGIERFRVFSTAFTGNKAGSFLVLTHEGTGYEGSFFNGRLSKMARL